MNKLLLISAFLFITINLAAGAIEGNTSERVEDNIAPFFNEARAVEQSGAGGGFISGAVNSFVGGITTIIGYPLKVIGGIWKWLLWDYSFFSGSFAYVRWVILMPISLSMIIGIILPLFRNIA